jgi:integrase
MSVRKRTWTTRGKLNPETGEREPGELREAWIVDYLQNGVRHIETFARKKDAAARHAEVKVDVKSGVHVAPSRSITLKQAGESWIKAAEHELERTTVDQYKQHLKFHLLPFIGARRLTDITTDAVLNLEARLRDEGRSKVMVRKVLVSLGSILADAQIRKQVGHNAVRDLRRARGRGKANVVKREKVKLEVGKDIPSPAEVAAILAHAKPKWRPLLVTAAFTGLRASELRGLRWSDVDSKKNEIHVRQRADRYNVIGPPKTEASKRVVPFGKVVANTIKEWKLKCAPGELVFPNRKGKVEYHTHIVNRGFIPAQIAAGIVTKDDKAKYTGLHALRHFYASLCINSREDGGFGLLPKAVQERMGHSSITVTMDTYGHLFPRGDDSKVLDAVEGALIATQTQHAG